MMLVALLLDALVGWPNWLYAKTGHPVTWIGSAISRLDRAWNLEGSRRRLWGVLAAFVIICVAVSVGTLLQYLLPEGWLGVILGGVLAWPLIASRSLFDHVSAVSAPLAAGDLEEARHAVSMIVGRDTTILDEAGVARSALESLGENFSDGIVAPIFWGAVAGLPGVLGYKAINTLDSMIGYRTERHAEFGWASAKIDDVANYIPARLTALLIALTSANPIKAMVCVVKDARFHRSPNAGWPEASLAGGLGVRLSGPRTYQGQVSDEKWVNSAGQDPTSHEISRGLRLYCRATLILALLLFAVWGLLLNA